MSLLLQFITITENSIIFSSKISKSITKINVGILTVFLVVTILDELIDGWPAAVEKEGSEEKSDASISGR